MNDGELKVFPGTNDGKKKYYAERYYEEAKNARYNPNTNGRPKKTNRVYSKKGSKILIAIMIIITTVGLAFSHQVDKVYADKLEQAGYSREFSSSGSGDPVSYIVDKNTGKPIDKNSPLLPTRAEAREEVIEDVFGGRGR